MSAFPTDVTGIWKSEFDSQIGLQKYTFSLKQNGTNLTGTANSEAGERKREAELKEGKVEGDVVSFVEMMNFQENEIRITYTGKLSADANEIKFTREVGDFAKEEIVAKREQTPSAASPPTAKALRIKAGKDTTLTDSNGNVWLAEQGFEGGSTVDHDPPVAIAGTKNPELFQSEHYSMDSFSCKIPNGKLYRETLFCRNLRRHYRPRRSACFPSMCRATSSRISMFGLKAGGPNRAYVETVPVEVTNGEFRIGFTAQG